MMILRVSKIMLCFITITILNLLILSFFNYRLDSEFHIVRVSDISNGQFVIASKSFTDSTHTKTNNYMILVNKNGDLLNSYSNKPNEAQSWQF